MIDTIRHLPGFDLAFRAVDRLARSRRMNRHLRDAGPILVSPPVGPQEAGRGTLSADGTVNLLARLCSVHLNM